MIDDDNSCSKTGSAGHGGGVTRRLFAGAAAAYLIFGASEAEAKRRRRRRGRQRRDAVRRGELIPLYQLIRTFEEHIDGEVLDVRYKERDDDRGYLFVVLSPGGRIERYVMDARTGRIFTIDEAREHYGIEP